MLYFYFIVLSFFSFKYIICGKDDGLPSRPFSVDSVTFDSLKNPRENDESFQELSSRIVDSDFKPQLRAAKKELNDSLTRRPVPSDSQIRASVEKAFLSLERRAKAHPHPMPTMSDYSSEIERRYQTLAPEFQKSLDAMRDYDTKINQSWTVRPTRRYTMSSFERLKQVVADNAFSESSSTEEGRPSSRKIYNITLYSNDLNPGGRAVKLLLAEINLKIMFEHINNFYTPPEVLPKFERLNPLGVIPALDDAGFIITESHAIMTYLIHFFGQDDKLYPKNIKARTTIDSRFQYFANYLMPAGKNILEKVLFLGFTSITPENMEELKKRLHQVDSVLLRTRWIAGNHMTIADFQYIALLATWQYMSLMPDFSAYLHIMSWIKRCRRLMAGYEKVMLPAMATLRQQWDEQLIDNRLRPLKDRKPPPEN